MCLRLCHWSWKQQRLGWGMGAARCSGILTAIWAPAWSITRELTAQINKQLKFCSKGITEMNTQERRERTKQLGSWL